MKVNLNHKSESLADVFGLTIDRSEEIGDLIRKLMLAETQKSKLIQKLAFECDTTEELVFAMYQYGRFEKHIETELVKMADKQVITGKGN